MRAMRNALLALALVVAAASPAAAKTSATILVDGNALDAVTLAGVQLVTVERAANAPDACTIELAVSKQAAPDSPFGPGQVLEVRAPNGATIFKGEVVGLEPTFASRGPGRIVVRAFNKMHRLARTRRTKTWLNKTDSEIVQSIAEEAGLSVSVTTVPIRHDHVYQNNQTDLEFIRVRAARLGYQIHEVDGTLFFAPAPALDGAVERSVTLVNPRVFSAGAAPSRVEVRGWDPVNKAPIVGHAGGGAAGASYLEDHADAASEEPLQSDYLFFSQADADAVATAALRERILASQTAEGDTDGDPALRVGMTVALTAAGSRFNGKYLVTGCTHRFTSKGGGYVTFLKLKRNAAG